MKRSEMIITITIQLTRLIDCLQSIKPSLRIISNVFGLKITITFISLKAILQIFHFELFGGTRFGEILPLKQFLRVHLLKGKILKQFGLFLFGLAKFSCLNGHILKE